MDFDRRTYIIARLAFYELGRPEALVKVYADGYKKSAERYKVDLTRVLSSPEQNFALRYRIEIRTVISDVVRGKTTLPMAPLTIPVEECHRFAAWLTRVKPQSSGSKPGTLKNDYCFPRRELVREAAPDFSPRYRLDVLYE